MLKKYLTIKKLKKMRYVLRGCLWLFVGASHKRLLPFYRSKIYRKFRNFNLGMRWARKNVAQPVAVAMVMLFLVAGQALPLVAYEAHVVNVTAQIKNDMPSIEPANLEICLPGTGDPSNVILTAPFATAELVFSVDGSVPDCEQDTRYSSPWSFGLSGLATVKARTCYDGKQSAVAEWQVNTIDCGGGPRCGNGILEAGEQCDDGNNESGDGCSAMCNIEQAICDPAVELVQNGGFEAPIVDAPQGWDVFVTDFVPYWQIDWVSSSPSDFGGLTRPEGALLELHHGVNGWTAQEGEQYAELDSDWDGPEGAVSGEPASAKISQQIVTVPGEQYHLKFYFSPRPETGENNNVLSVKAGNGLVDETINGPAGGGNTNWSEYNYSFVADSSLTKLEFADLGESDSFGTFLDNVSLRCIPHEPECGDGVKEAGEQCDDGNNVDGDGCSALCQLEDDPQYPLCEIDGSYTEILGAGMGNQQSVEHNPQTLMIDGLENVEKIKAQVVVKALKQDAAGGYEQDLPESVLIESANGESYLISSPTVAVAGFGYFYEAEFAPADWIKATVNGVGSVDYYNPRALFAYVFRKGLNYESQFKTPNVSLYWKADDRPHEHTETFNVPINTTARNIKVVVAISELADDCREVELTASAGSVNVSQTYSQSNVGDEAHVATLILPNVPGDVTTVEVKVISPDDHPGSCDADGDGLFDDFGDSIYWNGVSVTTDCVPQPAAPICGNGQLEAGEQCDDGNNVDGDGCSALCQIETAFCGNNVREDDEECDGVDGVTAGYYCTDNCLLAETGGLGCMKINEVYYDVDATHGSEDDEWIELYNACDYTVNLKDWYFKDNHSTEIINQNYSIDAGVFVVVAANANVWNTLWASIPNNAFKIALGGARMFNNLANGGDRVFLYDKEHNLVDAVSWGSDLSAFNPSVPVVAEGHSIARKPAGYDTDSASDWLDTHAGSDPAGPNPGTNPHDEQGNLILKQEEDE